MNKQLKLLVVLVLALACAVTAAPKKAKPKPKPDTAPPAAQALNVLALDNASFYKDGKFDAEKGKDAVIALMRYHGYPVYPGIREKIWVSDYGRGQFTSVGLAAVMWKNNVADKYMLMDLFLMPGQMLPEHWHLEAEGNPAKLEGWLVRYGSSHIMGEGDDNMTVKVPKIHNDGQVTVKHDNYTMPGEFQQLNKVGAHHWQLAGPAGAIITEVANCHTDSGVRHLDKEMNDFFLKPAK